MTYLVLILGLFLLAIAVTMVLRAITTPAGPSTETLEQISAYGFAGTSPPRSRRARASGRGWATSPVRPVRRSAGASRASGEGLSRPADLGGHVHDDPRAPPRHAVPRVRIACLLVWLWLGALMGASPVLLFLGMLGAAALGWVVPMFVVDSAARDRRDQIERGLPDLIDLLVVTLEAGLSFPQSLRLAATKIREPLSSEVRLTLQEQNMGLTLVEALENLLARVDTPGVRMFSRSIAQGETMGVSTGQIMRNLAIELRKRQRAAVEERAQKAPVKILFPILFLIMPALFIVLLLPVMITVMDVLG